jgi:hypothetical protein
MPREIRRRRHSEDGKLWKITEGKNVVGESETVEQARRSIAYAEAYRRENREK